MACLCGRGEACSTMWCRTDVPKRAGASVRMPGRKADGGGIAHGPEGHARRTAQRHGTNEADASIVVGRTRLRPARCVIAPLRRWSRLTLCIWLGARRGSACRRGRPPAARPCRSRPGQRRGGSFLLGRYGLKPLTRVGDDESDTTQSPCRAGERRKSNQDGCVSQASGAILPASQTATLVGCWSRQSSPTGAYPDGRHHDGGGLLHRPGTRCPGARSSGCDQPIRS